MKREMNFPPNWTKNPIQGFLMSKYPIKTKLEVIHLYQASVNKHKILIEKSSWLELLF